MGLIGRFLGLGAGIRAIGDAAESVAEVFRPNATSALELDHAAFAAVQAAAAAEYTGPRAGRFDRFVNALNRLPRPALALGTLGLFVHAMAAPESFARRMRGLAEVPEPLWWLLGAVVGFYFGAREMHYLRQPRPAVASPPPAGGGANAALADWRANRDQ